MSEKLSKDFVSYTRNVLPTWYDDFSEEAWRHTVKYIDSIQEKLDAKDKEIESLRGFVNKIYDLPIKDNRFNDKCIELAKKYGLLDENGNPTHILTDDK